MTRANLGRSFTNLNLKSLTNPLCYGSLSAEPARTLAASLVRKLAGGAQAHLIEAEDGHLYVVKFLNNPQHRRVLINEWIGSGLLRWLNIPTPQTALVGVTADFIRRSPVVGIETRRSRLSVEPGWHFGSRFRGHQEDRVCAWLPDSLLRNVTNLRDFLGVLAFDKWTNNTDARQALFTRRERRIILTSAERTVCPLFVEMIDNASLFGGPTWRFGSSAIQGLYGRLSVYTDVRGIGDFEPWLSRILDTSADLILWLTSQLPRWWTDGESEFLDIVFSQLMRRRARVASLIEDCRNGPTPFPNWR